MNYGIDDITISTPVSGKTFGDGKVTSKSLDISYTNLSIPWTHTYTGEFSYAFWVKPKNPNAWSDIISFGAYANRIEKANTTDYHWYSNDSTATLVQSGLKLFTLNNATWYHIAMVSNGSTVKFYVNGVVTQTANQVANLSTIFGSTNTILISQRTSSGGNRYYGYLNDVRFYDHALTPREVKELSQGLVAHYQLKGMGRTNYLKGAGDYTEDNPLIRNANDVGHMYDSYVYHNNSILSVTIPVEGTYTWILNCNGQPTGHPTTGTTGSSYLFSMWLQHQSTGNHYHWGNYGTAPSGEHYGSITLPVGTYNLRTNLYAADNVNYTLKMWNIRLVKGGYDTDSWTPNTADPLASALGIRETIGSDCSGFGNSLIPYGAVHIVNDSPRYNRCIDFNQTGFFYKNDFNMVTNQFTVSFWIKAPSTVKSQHFLFGTHYNWTGDGFSAWTDAGLTYSVLIRSNAESSHGGLSFTVPANIWTMVTYVYTGTVLVGYINGKEFNRITYGSGGSVSHPYMYLGNSWYSGAPVSEIDESHMSDFRFYATALSTDDIQALYKPTLSLDKNGQFYATEYKEIGGASINKDCTITAGNLNGCSSPTRDMKITALDDGSVWARIHHLDVSGLKSFYTNSSEIAKCINKSNRYSRMGIVDKYKKGGTYEFMLTYPSMHKPMPAGYTRLDYIEATGTQYVRTGVVNSAIWQFDIQFTNITTRQLMGYGGNGSEYWGSQENGMYGLATWSYMNVASGGRDIIVHDYTGSNSLWVKGTTLGISQTDVTSKEYQIFAIGGSYLCNAKLWRCRCVQNGVLIRDFIPAKRNSDGYVGLLDVVNNVFYGNSGSGTFKAGYLNEHQPLQHIESTGSQYINSGVTWSTNDLRIQGEYSYTALSGHASIFGTQGDGGNLILREESGRLTWYASDGAIPITTVAVGDNIKFDLTTTASGGYSYNVSVNENTVTGSGTTNVKFDNNPIYIFDTQINGGRGSLAASTITCKAKLKYLNIWKGGTLVRSFIPCVSPSGQLGLFDNVEKKFYINSGTGNLISGATKKSLPLYNRWIQTSSPSATSVSGFKALETAWNAHNFGIRTHGSDCLYNCDSGGTWYAPIGQYRIWEGGIPAADGTMQTKTELWVRINDLELANKASFFDCSISATNYHEI